MDAQVSPVAPPPPIPTPVDVVTPAQPQVKVNSLGAPTFSVTKPPVCNKRRSAITIGIVLLLVSIVLFIIYAFSVSKAKDEVDESGQKTGRRVFLKVSPSDWFQFTGIVLGLATVTELTYIASTTCTF